MFGRPVPEHLKHAAAASLCKLVPLKVIKGVTEHIQNAASTQHCRPLLLHTQLQMYLQTMECSNCRGSSGSSGSSTAANINAYIQKHNLCGITLPQACCGVLHAKSNTQTLHCHQHNLTNNLTKTLALITAALAASAPAQTHQHLSLLPAAPARLPWALLLALRLTCPHPCHHHHRCCCHHRPHHPEQRRKQHYGVMLCQPRCCKGC